MRWPALLAALAIIAGGAIGVAKLAGSDDKPTTAAQTTPSPRATTKKQAREPVVAPAPRREEQAPIETPQPEPEGVPAPSKGPHNSSAAVTRPPKETKESVVPVAKPRRPPEPEPEPEKDPAKKVPVTEKDPAEKGAAKTPVSVPLPSKRMIEKLPPAARDKLLEARKALKKGDTQNAIRLAESSFREGGGDLASALEVIARCRRREQKRSAPVIRRINNERLARRLWAYCTSLRR